jgi:hypothetical protein
MAIAADSNSYEAQWKASRNAVEAGEVATGSEQRKLYGAAERHARRAVKLNPTHAEGTWRWRVRWAARRCRWASASG